VPNRFMSTLVSCLVVTPYSHWMQSTVESAMDWHCGILYLARCQLEKAKRSKLMNQINLTQILTTLVVYHCLEEVKDFVLITAQIF